MSHIKDIPVRPSKEDLEALSKFSPATIHEAQGRRGAL
ncbi:S-adenosylmethionine--2-demethylmenaquinone methyltransferase, partial [Rhizobium sp. Td3]